MDKRAGSSWHVVVGEGFGFEITHEMRNMLYMYFGGNVVPLLDKGNTSLESLVKGSVRYYLI
jgi:dynein light chain 4, axonemal